MVKDRSHRHLGSTMPALDEPTTRVGSAVIHRQPVVHPDRSVFGYAVRGVVLAADGTEEPPDRADHHIDAQYRILDGDLLTGDKLLVLRATKRIFLDEVEVPYAGNGLVLEIPAALSLRPDAYDRLATLKMGGWGLAIGEYTGSARHDRVLNLADYVKVDVERSQEDLAEIVERAMGAGSTVIAERADNSDRIHMALEAGAELLQGPMFERRRTAEDRPLSAGEVQCLELVRLLSAEYPDQDAVVRVIGVDPELTMRVLHLVNSSATGVRRHIDSVRQAVVLVGPRQLHALAMASIVDARTPAVGPLWSVLTRALTVSRLTSSDAGYTVGMLSAVASHLRISVDSIIERSGVSDAIASALRDQTGPLGPVLAAVLAHEENDTAGVVAAGFEPMEVAHTHLAAIPEALATATALAAPAGG
jgi:EAL and modified HD-GYP domain-containing signal transduction protein